AKVTATGAVADWSAAAAAATAGQSMHQIAKTREPEEPEEPEGSEGGAIRINRCEPGRSPVRTR
ncbi:MAG: hypothetical protein QOF15_4260, partial [Mycobacterium sp.]|nr:hypothetical protein [Mycobacterium sp.]